jgi:hypothetical protein
VVTTAIELGVGEASEHVLQLQPPGVGATLDVAVRRGGCPRAGVGVRLAGLDDEPPDITMLPRAAVTDERGHAVFLAVPTGMYWIFTGVGETFDSAWVEILAAETVELDLDSGED